MQCFILPCRSWSSLYNETSAEAAVYRLNVAVTEAIDLAVPSGYIRKHKYPTEFTEIFLDFFHRPVNSVQHTPSSESFQVYKYPSWLSGK
jgi:hypothetical protein